mmetsp:Transcript_102804/g.201622  ORF Transcript_102804/g.201622 Transcript_102804/m.201622 type:complete len:108 (+) Transcript_102804:78-401(+)
MKQPNELHGLDGENSGSALKFRRKFHACRSLLRHHSRPTFSNKKDSDTSSNSVISLFLADMPLPRIQSDSNMRDDFNTEVFREILDCSSPQNTTFFWNTITMLENET